MEKHHREHIIKNVNELIRLTKYSDLINACERSCLISKVMSDRIESSSDSNEYEKHKQLFIKLTKRGPKAYDEIIEILINLKFSAAATLLYKLKHNDLQYISINPAKNNSNPVVSEVPAKVDIPSKDNADSNVTLQPFTNKSQLTSSFEVKKSNRIHGEAQMPVYSMKSKNRGVFFMVNIIDFSNEYNKKRNGAEIDEQSLLFLFLELGFTCFPYKNLTGLEFFEILKQLRSSEYLKQTECFVMALMSHGEMTDDMHDRVEFSDGSVVKTKDIEDEFLNDKCPSLMHKPKVLIFPFCRGMTPDKGVFSVQHDSIEMNAPTRFTNIATLSDMLVCYASVRGFKAIREPLVGSWYITTFCKVLAENAHNMDFERMLKLIGNEMQRLRSEDGSLQTPASYNHGFNKLLYFNPGLYED